MTRVWLLTAMLLAACGKNEIAAEFAAQRALMVTVPGAAPASWEPDGILNLSPALIDSLMRVGLETYGATSGSREARGPLGVRGTVEYEMEVRRLNLSGTDRCERCIEVRTRLGGDVNYRFGPVRGSSPVTITVVMDVRIDVEPGPESSFVVTLNPQSVDDVTVSVANLRGGIRSAVETELSEFGQQALLERMQPVPVGTFGGEQLPLRALTVAATEDGGAVLSFLTRSPTSQPLSRSVRKLRDGWQLDISQASLLGFAAKASFEMGELSHGVVVEPRGLRISTRSFEMDVRLWKPTGAAWWRDYLVRGDLSLNGNELGLSATSVEEVAQSPGAVFADPLVAIGESFIIKAIQDGVNQNLPLAHSAQASQFEVDLGVRSVIASEDTLIVKGSLSLSPREEEAPTSGMTRPAGGMTRPR